MKIHFDTDLETLRHRLIDMSNNVKKMIQLATRIFFDQDPSLLDEIYEIEDLVNHQEIDIEEFGITLIALHQPAAKDLRMIITVLKMSTLNERMGDLAVNIAKRIPRMIPIPWESFPDEIHEISEISMEMLEDAVSSFLEQDPQKAREICLRDDVVDDLNRRILTEFISEINQSEIDTEKGLEMVMISKQYERIADCATNIAEEVIFYVKGKNIKHHYEEEKREESLKEIPTFELTKEETEVQKLENEEKEDNPGF